MDKKLSLLLEKLPLKGLTGHFTTSRDNQQMATHTAQDFLFQRIREILQQHTQVVDAVSEILHIRSDNAYRWIRCERPLVLDEVRQLCEHFHLTMDLLS